MSKIMVHPNPEAFRKLYELTMKVLLQADEECKSGGLMPETERAVAKLARLMLEELDKFKERE